MRRVNMQSLGITEVCVNTLALLDIKSPKNDSAKSENGRFVPTIPTRLGAFTQGRKCFFSPDQARVATGFFPLEQRVLVLALTDADS
jgi:hypothetical protein